MANPEHLELLHDGVAVWNAWREEQSDVRPDLSGAELAGLALEKINLQEADLSQSVLTGTDLSDADLSEADLSQADLVGATLSRANLNRVHSEKANLREAKLDEALLAEAKLQNSDLRRAWLVGARLQFADLSAADLSGAIMSFAWLWNTNLCQATLIATRLGNTYLGGTRFDGADLTGAHLSDAQILRTSFRGAKLIGCNIYGASVWDVEIDEQTKQSGLIITPVDEPVVMVDDLEVGQFIHMLLKHEKIRNVIDTVTQRGVLILGRFGDSGLVLLQAIAAWLRKPENGGYLPLLFDFARPESKTYTETVRTLAGLARFVIVDLSGPSVPQEITAIVDLHDIPFVPILEQNREDWSMFRDFLVKERVLEPIRFADQDHLLKLLAKEVIAPAEKLIEKRQKRLDKIFGRA